MTATPSRSSAAGPSKQLVDKLAKVLPKGFQFGVYHFSTPPTKTEALCSAPPGEREDRTFRENHFLTLTVDGNTATTTNGVKDAGANAVPVMAIEILLFTTAHSSTFFVSKADSTGYLALLNLPRGTPSPIRTVCGVFLSHLVESRRRKDIQSVVSLFARAQDQYLFPGSIKNKTKHVLDDRGLVKWWCRVLDPLVRDPPTGKLGSWGDVNGYLVVPGLDSYETRAFLPRASGGQSHWALQDALEKVSHYTREFDWVPPRCLIPRYPDDPKSRFREELDEEAAKTKVMQTTGMWKSIRSLDQFWEMLAFRQECSSGRMTGFIWVVLDPKSHAPPENKPQSLPTPNASFHNPVAGEAPVTPKKPRDAPPTTPFTTPQKLFPTKPADDGTPIKTDPERRKKKKKKLTGPIKTRQPRVKTRQKNRLLRQKATSPYYYWPPEGRGQRIISENDYKRSVELLLHLDFANLELAMGSMRRWIKEVGMGETWGLNLDGEQELAAASRGEREPAAGIVNNLSGLVKRKRPQVADGVEDAPRKINVLGARMIRKKPKEDAAETVTPDEEPAPAVNTLGAGMVRKRPKA